MNPNHNNSNEHPGLSLPTPYFEAGKEPNAVEKPLSRPAVSPESLSPTPPPSAPAGNPLKDSPIPASNDPKATSNTASSGAMAATQLTSSPLKADDLDLIEKEWVAKAKQIVESTKEDPYVQTKEMNNFKADYVKKRYNKDLKLAEE